MSAEASVRIEGVHATIEELANAKGVAVSYVSRVLRLTLLAPDIVEAILDGRQPVELQLDDLLCGFPIHWKEQQPTLAGLRGPQRRASFSSSWEGGHGCGENS